MSLNLGLFPSEVATANQQPPSLLLILCVCFSHISELHVFYEHFQSQTNNQSVSIFLPSISHQAPPYQNTHTFFLILVIIQWLSQSGTHSFSDSRRSSSIATSNMQLKIINHLMASRFLGFNFDPSSQRCGETDSNGLLPKRKCKDTLMLRINKQSNNENGYWYSCDDYALPFFFFSHFP